MGGMIDYLKDRGIEISEFLGIDLIREFIETSKYKHRNINKRFEFLRGNFIMEKFQPKKKYDLVVCLGMLVTRTRNYEEYMEYMVSKAVTLSQDYVLFNVITEISSGSQNYPRQGDTGGTTSIKEQDLVKILDRIKVGTKMEYKILKENIYPDATDAFVQIKV
jgi:hypothetical protein